MNEHEKQAAGDSQGPRYIAGWNLAGYLPETDPEVFDTLQEAADYLDDTLERWRDDDAALDDEEQPSGHVRVDRGADYADGWYGDTHLWAEPYTEETGA